MLAVPTRVLCGAVLVWLAACESGPPAPPAQDDDASVEEDDADGGSDPRTDDDKNRVATANSARKPDAAVPRSGSGGSGGGSGGKPQADADAGADDKTDEPADQGGAGAPAPSAGAPAAGSGSTNPRDPFRVLWDLARRTSQGMNAETIRRFLDALNSGDTPASSNRGSPAFDRRRSPLFADDLAGVPVGVLRGLDLRDLHPR